MCTLKSMQLMATIVDLLSQLRSAKICYISSIGTHVLKSLDEASAQSEIPIEGSFYETIIQVFRNISLLIVQNKDNEKVIDNAISYIKDLNSIIEVPNFKRQTIDSVLSADIQKAIDYAQDENNSNLRDLLIKVKSKINV